jgi:hypothetical protein
MKASKKKFIGIFGLACAAILALSIYLNAKAKDSRALAQYIPPSAYLVRINTQKALRLAYALRKDSFAKQQASSKWAALFNDSTKTGIDFFVDPWVFGDSSSTHLAFQLKSVSNFVQWMKEVADTTFFVQKIQGFQAKESGATFFTNGSKVAMLSLAPLPIALKTGTAFYSQKNRPVKRLEDGDGLARLWLNKPLKWGKFIRLRDSSLILNIKENTLSINPQNAVDMRSEFSLGFRLNQEKWSQMKKNPSLKDALKILGLQRLKIAQENPFLQVSIKDTFHKVSTSYSYEFDDDFNKVKVAKTSIKVVPNMAITLRFKSKQDRIAFGETNQLSQYKHDFLRLSSGENWLQFGMKRGDTAQSLVEHLVLHRQALKETLAYTKSFSRIKWGMFEDLNEFIYVNRPNTGTYLSLSTKKHPIHWLMDHFGSERSPD